jgi:hypothetical protein
MIIMSSLAKKFGTTAARLAGTGTGHWHPNVQNTYHDVNFVAQSAVLLSLDDEQHAIQQENVAWRLGSVHAERALDHQFAVGPKDSAPPGL